MTDQFDMPSILRADAKPLPPVKPPAPPAEAARTNRRWWIIALVVVALVVVTIAVLREPLQQITPEVLAAARAKWDAADIQNYKMTLTMKVPGSEKQTYDVTVRDGKVAKMLVNGLPPTHAIDRLSDYTMTGLFDILTREIDIKDDLFGRQSGSVMMRGAFDDKTGMIRRYIRVIGGTGHSSEIRLESFTPMTGDAPTNEPATQS